MKHLLIGAAVVAFAVSPLVAQGNGHGKGQSGAQGNDAHGPAMQGPSMKSPGKQASGHGNAGHASGSMASTMEARVPEHGGGKVPGNRNNAGKVNGAAKKGTIEHGGPAMVHAEKRAPQAMSPGKGNGVTRPVSDKSNPHAGVKVLQDGRHYYSQRNARETIDFAATRHGLIDGCPPGLAKNNNGCLPPGQAKRRVYQPGWWGLTGAPAGSYGYDSGYLLRLNGDRVAGYLPLLGGALSPGNIWPSYYAATPVPNYYVDYYDLGQPAGYRYADNVLYRVDSSTSAITSIAALLTGDNFQIGSALPPGYDVYNVPYTYRSQYPDGPNARYRYSDGYIYQVDPTTQLIIAAIDLLAGR